MDKSNWQYNTISDIKVTKVKNGYVVDLFIKFRKKDPSTGNACACDRFVFLNGTDVVDFLGECLCDNQGDTGIIETPREEIDRGLDFNHECCCKTKKVTLKNGTEETNITIDSVMLSLNWLMNIDMKIVVRELYELCKNPCYTLPESIIQYLVDLKLINRDGGRPERLWYVQDSVRNIVLSTVRIKGADFSLTIPVETTD